MRIDSRAATSGIGTDSPSHELTVSAANDSGIRIDAEGNNVALMLTDETTSNGFRLNYNAPSDILSFDTTNGTGAKVSERMRIDASGNLLVGRTNTFASTATSGGGSVLNADGLIEATKNGTIAMLNRNTTDGNIVDFRKDGTIVGVIGTQNWGIGTASPVATLDVNGSVVAATQTAGSITGSQTPDMSTYQNFVWTLTGNITLANPTTEKVGQTGFFVFIHSGGARTVSLGTQYRTPGGAGLTLSSTSGAVDFVPYAVRASGIINLGTPQLAFA